MLLIASSVIGVPSTSFRAARNSLASNIALGEKSISVNVFGDVAAISNPGVRE